MFKNRLVAGEGLAKEIEKVEGDLVLLAIARGGVPVAYAAARKLALPLDVVVPRKIPIPWSPEAGFGAVAPDGTVVLNQALVASLELRPEEIEKEVEKVKEEIERRNREYRRGRPPLDLRGKSVVIIDDGLASGYTMLAAVESARKNQAAKVIAAVPVSPASSVRLVESRVDRLICLLCQEAISFAVADYYEEWEDVTDTEVIEYLRKAEEWMKEEQ
jgi:putative phosphoribosyl transferase